MAGTLNSAEGKARAAEGRRLRKERRIKDGEIVPNRPLRARYEAVQLRPGYSLSEIAERAGFVNPSGRFDTTHLRRQMGMERMAPTRKKGVLYEGSFTDYIPYDTAVKICRALDMLPVEAGL